MHEVPCSCSGQEASRLLERKLLTARVPCPCESQPEFHEGTQGSYRQMSCRQEDHAAWGGTMQFGVGLGLLRGELRDWGCPRPSGQTPGWAKSCPQTRPSGKGQRHGSRILRPIQSKLYCRGEGHHCVGLGNLAGGPQCSVTGLVTQSPAPVALRVPALEILGQHGAERGGDGMVQSILEVWKQVLRTQKVGV